MDLRNNGGGSLEEAKGLTGLFIPQGPVVQIRQQNGRISIEDDGMDADQGIAYSGPLTVLVNRLTASASEIFAGAIQDYHRGLVVGSTTYGKGTVQYLYDLNRSLSGPDDAGQLWLTVNKFYRVTGSSTQTKGVTPDISLPSYLDPAEFGESSNDTALPWDEISPAEFSPEHLGLESTLPRIEQSHDQRVAKDPAWHLYLDALKDYQQQRAETSVSLVLSEREKQRKDDDKQRLALLNGWRKLKNQPPATSLEEANKPSNPASATTAASTASADDPDAATSDTAGIEPDVLLDETTQIVADMATAAPKPPLPSAVAASHADLQNHHYLQY
jgi:carboxyl-terminal processing protease